MDLNRLTLQAACQRYRQTFLDANSEKLAGVRDSFVASLQAAFAKPAPALV